MSDEVQMIRLQKIDAFYVAKGYLNRWGMADEAEKMSPEDFARISIGRVGVEISFSVEGTAIDKPALVCVLAGWYHIARYTLHTVSTAVKVKHSRGCFRVNPRIALAHRPALEMCA